jgi:dolichol kinase
VPALLAEPRLLGVSLAVAFAALAAVEVVRLGAIPGVSARVHAFMGSFVDARDSGLVFVSHFALLLGMAAPVWLSGALAGGGEWRPWPGALAGILILGVGDAAASAVGRRWGRTPVAHGSAKTVEGTLGGAVATLAVWALLLRAAPSLQLGGTWGGGHGAAVGWLVGATALSSGLEAATAQLDNLMVPLHYYALLCLL